jgi:hypothetical protein
VYLVGALKHLHNVERRKFLAGLLLLTPASLLPAADEGVSLRGKLVKGPDGKPALLAADGRTVSVTGDADTMGVLNDARLAGVDFEAVGKPAADQFAINPIHTHALYVHKDGKRLMVTYWCDVCAIRTYTPGLCWCCREETALDLRPDSK